MSKARSPVLVPDFRLLRVAILLGVGGSLLCKTSSEVLSELLHGGTLENFFIELEVTSTEATLGLISNGGGLAELLDLSHNRGLLDGVPLAGSREGFHTARRGP